MRAGTTRSILIERDPFTSTDAAAAFGPRARHFDTTAQLVAALPQGPDAASLLVKGSRFMGMERAVAALQALQPQARPEDPHAA